MNKSTIMIGDKQKLLREGIRTIIEPEPDLRVIGVADDSEELCESVRALRPDVVIVNMDFQPMNGTEVARWIKTHGPGTSVIILSQILEGDDLIRALAAGADGFLLQEHAWEELLFQIRSVLQGRMTFPETVARRLSDKLKRIVSGDAHNIVPAQPALDRFRLTDKECEISLLIAQGLTNNQIAEMLQYSNGTVRNYVSSVYEKIGMKDRAKAVIFLRELLFETRAE